jgi:hypothetical protein
VKFLAVIPNFRTFESSRRGKEERERGREKKKTYNNGSPCCIASPWKLPQEKQWIQSKSLSSQQ